jgi:hypothetical protein
MGPNGIQVYVNWFFAAAVDEFLNMDDQEAEGAVNQAAEPIDALQDQEVLPVFESNDRIHGD